MNAIRILCTSFAFAAAAATFAAGPVNPAGTWRWTTQSPGGDVPTTLKIEWKDGKLAGAYSNKFGDTAISNASLKDDVITFDVVRDLGGGKKYVVTYRGKVDGDTIKGTLEAPGRDGGEAQKLGWNAKRTAATPADEAK